MSLLPKPDPDFRVGLEKTRLDNAPFLFLNHHPKNYAGKVRKILQNKKHSSGIVYKLFFSKENVEIIQRGIILRVFYETKKRFKIKPQNPQSIHVVMLNIFNQYARQLPNQIREQIKELNERVLQAVVPRIITEIEQYTEYIKEIHRPFQPIDRPLNMSSRGNRTLPSVMNYNRIG